jgi:bifunctional non-homologous end joining protein LigD
MHPTLVREPFHRPGWVFERKEDGWRMLAYKEGGAVRLVSRRGVDHTAQFADIAAAVAKLPARTLILDGEVCVFDARLVSQFHLLGDSSTGELATPPVFIAFDLLRFGARQTAGLPTAGARRRDRWKPVRSAGATA